MFKEELEKILDEQIKNLFYETEGVYPYEKAEPYIKNAITSIINLVDKELENLKIAKLNIDKFTTDHADGYQTAVEDMNRHIDKQRAIIRGNNE